MSSGLSLTGSGLTVTDPTATAANITIDVSTITGGTNTRLLYDNGAKVGEALIAYDNATGNLTMTGNTGIADGIAAGSTLWSLNRFYNGLAMASTRPIAWSNNSGSIATLDTGISRQAAATIAVGDGTQGNLNGSIKTANYYLLGGDTGVFGGGRVTFARNATGVVGWNATNATVAPDAGISSVSAGVVVVGNGTAADVSGTLRAALLRAGGADFAITAVNVVSPTSPNRTISFTYAGTTYFIAAKTTND